MIKNDNEKPLKSTDRPKMAGMARAGSGQVSLFSVKTVEAWCELVSCKNKHI